MWHTIRVQSTHKDKLMQHTEAPSPLQRLERITDGLAAVRDLLVPGYDLRQVNRANLEALLAFLVEEQQLALERFTHERKGR